MKYLVVFAMLLLFTYVFSHEIHKPTYVTEKTVLKHVKIQPKEALLMAESHLSRHGTVVWKNREKLKTHIIKKGRYYYIKRSDFPAKTINWYVHYCIRIDSQSGELTYIK